MLQRLPTLGAAIEAKVRAAIPPDAAKAIAACSSLGWVAMQAHVAVLEAIVATLGVDSARAFFRETSQANLQGSLLKGVVFSALRIFGVGPLALFRMFPRGFATITRDCGTVRLGPTPGGDGTEAIFEDLPPVLRVRPFALSMGSVFEAVLDVGKRPGDVDLDASNLADGRLRYVLRAWDRTDLVKSVDDV